MIGKENAVDARFYNLVHEIVSADREGSASDRRTDKRQGFSATQWIAPRTGPELPGESEFIAIECRDLSSSGFSFFLPNRPDFDLLVAAFGTPPEVTYLAARVVRCVDVLIDSSGNVEYIKNGFEGLVYEEFSDRTTTPMVLVGCRFTERLDA